MFSIYTAGVRTSRSKVCHTAYIAWIWSSDLHKHTLSRLKYTIEPRTYDVVPGQDAIAAVVVSYDIASGGTVILAHP